MALHYLRGLRYLGFTRHSLEEGVEGVEDPGTRGADAQGPEWVDDPGAEEAEDVGTHDVGQGADVPVVEDLGAVVENPAVVEDHPGVEDPVAQDQEQGTAANLCRFFSYTLASFSLLQFDELLYLFLY